VVSGDAAIIVLTLVLAAGVFLVVTPPSPRVGVERSMRSLKALAIQLVAALVAAAIVLLVSGWLLPASIVGAAAFWATACWLGRQRGANREIERLDALASWIENVRDVLMAGEQPVGAITSTVSACPAIIRPQVRRLALGLARQDADFVFRRFADDLDDPLADLVATGLSIAVRRGARTVPVLTALADQTRQQVDRRRLVEAERAPTRREVRALTTIMGTLLLGLLLLGRSDYLAAYDTAAGQTFLAAALIGYAALILRVQRLAAFPRPGRFLTTSTAPFADDQVIVR
jgi:Flp pilus assembly protein TadB